jgi:hypothetical protein
MLLLILFGDIDHRFYFPVRRKHSHSHALFSDDLSTYHSCCTKEVIFQFPLN